MNKILDVEMMLFICSNRFFHHGEVFRESPRSIFESPKTILELNIESAKRIISINHKNDKSIIGAIAIDKDDIPYMFYIDANGNITVEKLQRIRNIFLLRIIHSDYSVETSLYTDLDDISEIKMSINIPEGAIYVRLDNYDFNGKYISHIILDRTPIHEFDHICAITINRDEYHNLNLDVYNDICVNDIMRKDFLNGIGYSKNTMCIFEGHSLFEYSYFYEGLGPRLTREFPMITENRVGIYIFKAYFDKKLETYYFGIGDYDFNEGDSDSETKFAESVLEKFKMTLSGELVFNKEYQYKLDHAHVFVYDELDGKIRKVVFKI